MKKIFLLFIVQFFALSCLSNSSLDKENRTTSVSKNKDQAQISNKILVGKWFIPHSADINIIFNKDETFVFRDFNIKLGKEEILKGKYQLTGNKLILIYNDRPKQAFNFYKGINGDENHYIKKGNYYFVKSD